MARRLVHVDVERDHELERGQRAVEPGRVGSRDDGVSRHRQHCPDLPLAGRLDLLREGGDRKLPKRLRQTAHAAGPAARQVAAALPRLTAGAGLAGGGAGEHRSALAVEVAGQRVEDVDEPACEGAELLRAGADPAVDGRAVGGGQLARHAADLLGGDAGRSGGRLGREGLGQLLDSFDPVEELFEVPRLDESLVEQHVDHREKQQRVGAGADEVVLVGLHRGAAASRVDHDDLAAALADPPQPPPHVGRGHQAAIRVQRVGTEDQQVLGPVDVGNGDTERGPEHVPAGDLLGHLVDGAGGEDVARPERLQQHASVEDAGEVVGGRVADVDAGGVSSVLVEQRRQPAVDLRECLVPARRLEAAVALDQRRPYAVVVTVEVGEAGALRADEAVAEDIGLVAADLRHPIALDRELEAAGRFAERTGRVAGLGGCHRE